jgi:hypothetical protein
MDARMRPEDWLKTCEFSDTTQILDPDGWDRSNFQEDWNTKITLEEMSQKIGLSTCMTQTSKYCNECKAKNEISMVGQGFTEFICEGCSEKNTHHNTGVPEYCIKCACYHKICQQCGKKMEG